MPIHLYPESLDPSGPAILRQLDQRIAGRRVVIGLSDAGTMAAAIATVWSLGGSVIPVDPHLVNPQKAWIAANAKACALVIDDAVEHYESSTPADEAAMLYLGLTPSVSEAPVVPVILWENLRASAKRFVDCFELTSASSHASALPLWTAAGLAMLAACCQAECSLYISPPGFEPGRTTGLWSNLYRNPGRGCESLSLLTDRLRTAIIMGMTAPPTLKKIGVACTGGRLLYGRDVRALEKAEWKVKLIPYWSPPSVSGFAAHAKRLVGVNGPVHTDELLPVSCGTPDVEHFPQLAFRISDGEVEVAGEGVVTHFYRDLGACASRLSRDGYIATGDQGWLSAEGELFLQSHNGLNGWPE